MQTKSLLIIAVLWLYSAVAHTDEVSLTFAPPLPTAGVIVSSYTGPRIGDIAPQFALPRLDGTSWNSRDQLGKNAVLLVLIGASPVLTGKGLTPQSVLTAIAKAAQHLRATNVETVVVSKVTGISLMGLNPQFDALNLRDDKGALASLFTISPTELTIVAIDRAGFLRRVETVHDPKSVAATMLHISDPTPKLEIGKPAPDFSMSDMHGRVRRLSDLRGQKNLLLVFFPQCFTGG